MDLWRRHFSLAHVRVSSFTERRHPAYDYVQFRIVALPAGQPERTSDLEQIASLLNFITGNGVADVERPHRADLAYRDGILTRSRASTGPNGAARVEQLPLLSRPTGTPEPASRSPIGRRRFDPQGSTTDTRGRDDQGTARSLRAMVPFTRLVRLGEFDANTIC